MSNLDSTKNLELGPGVPLGQVLKLSLQKIYGRHRELVDRYGVSFCTMKTNLFNVS